jgi:anti-sigma regulatory factor (Ser/Thr protein kinase)
VEIPADFIDADLQPKEAVAARSDILADPVIESLTVPDGAGDLPPVEWTKEFDFPGVLASVPECREQVMEFVAVHCPDEDDQIDLLVAIQEALANAALHGCHDDPAKRIHCRATANANEITVAVRDPGPGFDLRRADADKYVATKLSHGRGICLIRSLVTEVSFAHHGAEIVLRKRMRVAT